MLFTSFIFLQIFLPAVLIGCAVLKKISWKNLFLLIFSLIFYAWGEPNNVFLLLASLAMNYSIARWGLAFDKPQEFRKKAFILGIVLNLGVLFFFKYTSPLLVFLDGIFNFPFKYSTIVLPLGISFFTFQILSYLIDTYWKQNAPQQNFFTLSLYIMLFPQLVAGPIVKYHDISVSLEERRTTLDDYVFGIRRFVYGLSKKVLIANQMAYLADDIFEIPGTALDCKIAWIGIVAYALQIYFDFSGYSDMAIGIGRMLGFKFKENFNLPYISKSIQEFWRRWHISLSTWFKEYLYIPLGGSRVSQNRIYLNIMIVFIATGIWHGAGLNFVLWGAYYGVFLVLERFKLKGLLERSGMSVFAHIYTLLVVLIGWVLFRAESFSHAWSYYGAMFSFRGNAALPLKDFLSLPLVIIGIMAILLAGPVPSLKLFQNENSRISVRWFDFILQPLLMILVVTMLSGNTYNPFIYFRF